MYLKIWFFFFKEVFKDMINNEKKVDSRMRVQLGPSPVNHEKNTNRLNKWFRFI